MINLTFHKKDKSITGFKCDGHSGYAENGKDIVCSAVSTVLIGIVNEIKRYSEANYTIRTGYLELQIAPTKATDILMRYAYNTLKEVEEDYPDYLKISIE